MSDDTEKTVSERLKTWETGSNAPLLRLEGLTEFSEAADRLVRQARRKLYIVTPDLEPERFNTGEFADAISAFARKNRHAEARILIAEPAIAIRWGHRLVRLSQRLPSSLMIRQFNQEDLPLKEIWMLADGLSVLRRDSFELLKGSLSARSVPHAQRMVEWFEERWERSRQVPEFRQLDI